MNSKQTSVANKSITGAELSDRELAAVVGGGRGSTRMLGQLGKSAAGALGNMRQQRNGSNRR
jgi:hypothetical protein